MAERRPLLITGCPRSGTRTTARMLQKAGLRVGHERIRNGGAVCSYFAVDDYWYQGPHAPGHRRSSFAFDRVWHQTRHPLQVISSISFGMNENWWHWQEKHTGIGDLPKPIRAAVFWCRWNELVEPQAEWRYRIEDWPRHWPSILERLGLKPIPMPDVHAGAHRPQQNIHRYTWDELHEADASVAEQVWKLALKYGYEE